MYYGAFNCLADVEKEFQVSFTGTMIRAVYEQNKYDGAAVVIFVKDGVFYLVQASHCSCHGLEDQWSPEEMTAEALTHILRKGNLYGMGRDEKLADLIELIDVVKGSPVAIEGLVRQ